MDEIIERRVKEIEERRARGRKGHVAAQESYLERERQKKQAQVDQFVESVARCAGLRRTIGDTGPLGGSCK